jgi:predicted DNA-binding transcriptional regulator AlpA
MTLNDAAPGALESVISLSRLAEHLGVSVQTIYDMRMQGRGPHGFRVGRELQFRISEIERWLRELEAEDSPPHGIAPSDGEGAK